MRFLFQVYDIQDARFPLDQEFGTLFPAGVTVIRRGDDDIFKLYPCPAYLGILLAGGNQLDDFVKDLFPFH